MNRERWLTDLSAAMAPRFADLGKPIPETIRVACGWPSKGGTRTKARVLGQCFPASSSGKGVSELFISPVLDEPMRVAGVLAHELVHAAVGCQHGHRAPFARFAKALGLEGQPTATTEGDDFKAWVAPLLASIGEYPHVVLNHTSATKTQGTRMVKVVCRDAECGYVLRTTRKWLDEVGTPSCACGNGPMEEAV